MDTDSQIFIRVKPDKKPTEYLLADQPLRMIKYDHVTKDDIRRTVENNHSYIEDEYVDAIYLYADGLVITFTVAIDPVLKIVLVVEKHIM